MSSTTGLLAEMSLEHIWQVPVKKATNESTAEAKEGASADKAIEASENTVAEDAEVGSHCGPARDYTHCQSASVGSYTAAAGVIN